MYIESKLKEVGRTLFSLDLSAIPESNLIQEDLRTYSGFRFKAKIKIQFARGLFIVDAHFENALELTDIFKIKGDYIQISYLGKGDSYLFSSKKSKLIGMGRLNCCYDCNTVTTIKMPANKPTHYQAIFLSKVYYLQLLKDEVWVSHTAFYKHIVNENFLKWGSFKLPIDYSLYYILDEVTRGDWKKDFKKYYLDLKLKELFLSIHQCKEDSGKIVGVGIADAHLEKIKTAHAYLLENFTNPPTIKELARIVLLNELQLKKVFKKMYGKTIRSFIIDLRMKKAKSLIGKHSVAEMAEILGYKSVPHFISTFKKHYGHTPSQGIHQ